MYEFSIIQKIKTWVTPEQENIRYIPQKPIDSSGKAKTKYMMALYQQLWNIPLCEAWIAPKDPKKLRNQEI